MIIAILDAVTKQLGTTFGNGYHYYIEDIEQGLNKPAFHIAPRGLTQRSTSPVLYDRNFPLVIHYFSDDKINTKKDCYEKCELIAECLEYLPFKDTVLRTDSFNWSMVEDTLQVFINYRLITKKVDTETDNGMEELETSINQGV